MNFRTQDRSTSSIIYIMHPYNWKWCTYKIYSQQRLIAWLAHIPCQAADKACRRHVCDIQLFVNVTWVEARFHFSDFLVPLWLCLLELQRGRAFLSNPRATFVFRCSVTVGSSDLFDRCPYAVSKIWYDRLAAIWSRALPTFLQAHSHLKE